jgi:ADP-ribosylglycohydrolase
MLGAIAGDVIGSVHEHLGTKSIDFELFPPGCRFTDDTVLTVAVADCLMNGSSYVDAFHEYFRAYPNAGYGYNFFRWASSGNRMPYNSWGNGAAMRVSAVGYAFDRLEDVLAQAALSAEVTHNHPEGIKGAQATALAVFLARSGESKRHIKDSIERMFGYDLNGVIEVLRPEYQFDVSCQGTVPPALIAFLESSDFEDALRKAVSLGGDADTLACIAGAVAEAHYGAVPPHIESGTLAVLDDRLRTVLQQFRQRYATGRANLGLAPLRHRSP